MTNTDDEIKTNQQTIDRQAISAALRGDWQEAIQLNQQIIKISSENTSALNRLGIAYLKTQQLAEAKRAFQKVIDIDQFNTIAKANLKKTSPKYINEQSQGTPLSNSTYSFIEESGISKVIPIANVGEPHVIANLYTGLEVFLKPAARKVKVVTKGDQYIGSLPDDISIHLIKLLRAGNKYLTLIKSADSSGGEVFIKEVKRVKKVIGIPSFSTVDFGDLEIGGINQPSQPPLEIYDPVEDANLT